MEAVECRFSYARGVLHDDPSFWVWIEEIENGVSTMVHVPTGLIGCPTETIRISKAEWLKTWRR